MSGSKGPDALDIRNLKQEVRVRRKELGDKVSLKANDILSPYWKEKRESLERLEAELLSSWGADAPVGG